MVSFGLPRGYLPLTATQRPSLTPLDPFAASASSSSSSSAAAADATRRRRRRRARAALLAGALLASALGALHAGLPDDHALRETLRLPTSADAVRPWDAAASGIDFWVPPPPPLMGTAAGGNGTGAMEDAAAAAAGAHLPELDKAQLRATYAVFQPPAQRARADGYGAGVRPVPLVGDGCLEKWVGRGEPCEAGEVQEGEGELDVVWTWVNGSDPVWHAHFAHYADPAVTPLPADLPLLTKHYRNKDELRHSLRSVARAMAGAHGRNVRTFHLVLGDWALGADAPSVVGEYYRAEPKRARKAAEKGREWRVGQLPAWLDRQLLGLERDGVTVQVHHHAQVFCDRTAADERAALEYRAQALPNFNSFAIEGQLVNIPDLAPHFVYLNDDFFLTRNHSKADWVSPVLGPALGLVFPAWVPAEQYPATACAHEWSAMLRSNWLLGHRFGTRQRYGLEHVPKVFSAAALAEAAHVWAPDFAFSSRRRFREVERGATDESRVGDLHAMWLGAHVLVERAREAMLWSWAVARLGGLSGTWSHAARADLARALNVTYAPDAAGRSSHAQVRAFDRRWMDWGALKGSLEGMGVRGPEVTQLTWSSLDGPLPPDHDTAPGASAIDLGACLGAFWTDGADADAGEMFKRLAFEQPTQCGDRILRALVNASGPRGLSALLPPADLVLPIAPSARLPAPVQPHMPLTRDWRSTDFALGEVVRSEEASVGVRAWVLRCIARYQFTTARTEIEFAMIHHPADIQHVVAAVDGPGSTVSSLAINDDIEGDEAEQERSVEAIRSWLAHEWPDKGWWEL